MHQTARGSSRTRAPLVMRRRWTEFRHALEATVKVAAYQSPLLPSGSMAAIDLIAAQIRSCESAGVDILCCPEGVLGGLADDASRPSDIAINAQDGQLQTVLAPLASETVTTVLGFTELADNGRLFNTAAVYHKGAVLGLSQTASGDQQVDLRTRREGSGLHDRRPDLRNPYLS